MIYSQHAPSSSPGANDKDPSLPSLHGLDEAFEKIPRSSYGGWASEILHQLKTVVNIP